MPPRRRASAARSRWTSGRWTNWAWDRCRRNSSAGCPSCSCWSAAGTSFRTRCRRSRRCATAGLIIGAVSNWIWQLPELLHSLELVSHFDFVAASARVGYEKPHRGIFEHALAEAGVRPEEAIHVGDHIDADVQGAIAVGIAPVLIDRRERFTERDLPEGVPLIRSLAELVPLVDARLQRASA